ncbi:hypothetical protein ZIOFF_065032 [Zingiber officinale]|uniref:Uncharacterized protein n=1 Tax=Zingiber officinale TaxID=94328 RepID=A0A8J5KCX6_ZINOF|nr:hypothetical protein ZIOFF_065032 [Zingiber officinale]
MSIDECCAGVPGIEGRIMEMSDAASAAERERGIEKRKEVALCDSDAQHAASHRAYPKPLAKYENVVADPELFKETLMKLHAEMGTKFMLFILGDVNLPLARDVGLVLVPIIGGKGLDLHRLFVEVTSRGGIEKVVSEKRWREVTAAFSFPSTATNASFILRKYYLSLLHHYEQIYLFGAERWNPLNAPSNTPASSVASRRSLEPLKIYSEAQAASGKRRRNSGLSSPTYTPVIGVIDGKFEHGYFVTVTVGSEKLKGVLYHIPEQTAEQDPLASISADDGNLRSPHQHEHQPKLSLLDPNPLKQDNSGYNAFFAEQHARLLPLHPGQDTEISRIISVQWNELTETERAVFQERGMKDKERHGSEMTLCESSKPGPLVWDPLPMQQLPVKPVEEADVKLQKAGGDMKASDEDHCSSEDIDSGGGSSQVHPEIESSADVTTILGSMCSVEPSKEGNKFELLTREDEKLSGAGSS